MERQQQRKGSQLFARRLECASSLKPATPDASAFVQSVQLLRDVSQLLPLDSQGRPTLSDAATSRANLLLGGCKAARAYYLSPHVPVVDCEYEEALLDYMALYGKVWAAAAARWGTGSSPGTSGDAADGDSVQLGAILYLFTTGRGPDVHEAARRSAQAAAMLAEPTCHAAVGRQLAVLVASQAKPQSGARPPLLTAQQLQAACCRHAAEVAYAAATLQRRPNMRPAGFALLSVEQLAEVLAGQQRCAVELLRLEPEAPQSHVVAALALRSRGQEATADAELAGHYLRAFQMAQAAGNEFLLVKAASDSLGAAFLHCSRRGNAVSAGRLEAALAALQQAEPVLQRCKKYLPEAWTQQMEVALSFAKPQVASSRALLQYAIQHAAGSGGARLKAAAANLSSTVQQAHGVVVCNRVNADPTQRCKCAGCGQMALGLRQCARCKVARYCRHRR